jgi:hypothetical protein
MCQPYLHAESNFSLPSGASSVQIAQRQRDIGSESVRNAVKNYAKGENMNESLVKRGHFVYNKED